jgi:hypothetical protein
MNPKTIAGIPRDQIPPRVKVAPRSTNTVDMSTPEGRERVTAAIQRVIATHRVAIRELAKR